MQQQLLHWEVGLLPQIVPADSEGAKNRFLEKYRLAVPPVSLPARRSPQLTRAVLRGGAAAAAALLLTFTLGWYLGSQSRSEPLAQAPVVKQNFSAQQPPPNRLDTDTAWNTLDPSLLPVPPAAPNDISNSPRPEYVILEPFMENHLLLAKSENSRERLDLVVKLAELLWQETLQNLAAKDLTELVETSNLYLHVVAHALPRSARRLSENDKPALAKIAQRLQQRKTATQQIAKETIPAIGDVFLAIGKQSEDVAVSLLSSQLPATSYESPQSPTRSGLLLSALVNANIQLVERDAPLDRAEVGCDLADRFSQAIVFASINDEVQATEKLGQYLDDITEESIYVSLNRFQPEQATPAQLREYQELQQRGKHSTDVLLRNLERAPEAAKKGLQRALEAQSQHKSGKGHSRPTPKPNASGPPGRGSDFIPPGQRNRKPRDEKKSI